jgi:phospholipid-binding lipoprotein MlaA
VISVRDGLIETGADSFLESALDPYAAARSAYLQRRRAEILNTDGDAAAAEAAAAADADANPLGDDAASGVDADAGIPGTDTAPTSDSTPSATPPAAPSPEAGSPDNPVVSEGQTPPN